MTEVDVYLIKALESLSGAESECANERFNNCVNRCYYACFQAAIAALLQAGITPKGKWLHTFVQARFDELVYRRKRYPSELRGIWVRLHTLREKADYTSTLVTETEARRASRLSRDFVQAIRAGGENQ
jgi:uncharacterized protein (UPF0332 family)